MVLTKDYEEAEQHFLSAMDINIKFVDCMIEMARLQLLINNKKDAKKYYLQAKEINPKIKDRVLEKVIK